MSYYEEYNIQTYNKPRRGCGFVCLSILAAIGIIAVIAVGSWLYLSHQNPGTAEHQGAQVMMPYVVNTQSEVARSLLEQDGFVVTGYTFHKSYRKEEWGIVKEQPLEAGKYYPKGTKVKLVVWGEDDSITTTTKRNVSVPNLIGQYEEDFDSSRYPGLGFRFRKIPSSEPKGMIVRQSISPGTMVQEDTDLFVYYSGGPDAVALPNVTGWNKVDAINELQALGLNVRIIEDDNDGSQESGTVYLMDTLNGKTVEKGSTVTLYVWK